MVDLHTLLSFYLCGWAIASLILYAAGRRFSRRAGRVPLRGLVSFMGGALWPLVLVGLIEMSSIVVYTKVYNRPVF